MGFLDWVRQKQKVNAVNNRNALIERLLNRSNNVSDRGMAAEELGGCPDKEATDALLKVILDETDDFNVREESAGALGWTYKCVGIDDEAVARIPERFRFEMNLQKSC